jgi:DNA transformation protein and related proteins
MAADMGLVEWVQEAMAPIGTVTLRRMMGAATLYCDGTVFAVVDDSELWFKSDAQSDAAWDAAGCEKFSFEGSDGRIAVMNYRRAPADVYDDADALREWAALAVAAGLRAPKKKPKRAPGG